MWNGASPWSSGLQLYIADRDDSSVFDACYILLSYTMQGLVNTD